MHSKTRSLIKAGSLSLVAAVAASSQTVFAAGWDYTTMLDGIDLASIGTGALLAFAMMAVVVAGMWGGKKLLGIFGGK
jgi:hypothetical protein